MKTKATFLAAMLLAAAAAGKGGAHIGGVTWAAANVDGYQTFAARPDMYTKFYQWNRAAAWAADSSASEWNSTANTAHTWAVNPCPAGWRLPTHEEFIALSGAGSTWANANAKGNAVPGRFYGANHAACTLPNNMESCIFLPAAGYLHYGTLSNQGSYGYYWSNTQCEGYIGYHLYFYSSLSYPGNHVDKANGMPLRCVK